MAPATWDSPLSTGLADDFDLTITDAVFRTDEKYQGGGQTFLEWLGTSSDPDKPDPGHIWFSVGRQFSSIDGGLTIIHESRDDNVMPSDSSQYGRVISRCRNTFNITDILVPRGGPLEAKTWVGLRFHMLREEQPKVRGADKDPAPKLMPVQFLGVVDGNAVTVPGSGGAKVESAAEKLARMKAAQNGTNGNGNSVSLKTQVEKLAQAHKAGGKGFTDFQTAALLLPGIQDDDALLVELYDESGLWANA